MSMNTNLAVAVEVRLREALSESEQIAKRLKSETRRLAKLSERIAKLEKLIVEAEEKDPVAA